MEPEAGNFGVFITPGPEEDQEESAGVVHCVSPWPGETGLPAGWPAWGAAGLFHRTACKNRSKYLA